jgi:hypothetical protein
VLNAQDFVPSGEFHLHSTANALRDGNFAIHGLAVAMLKPIEAKPTATAWMPMGDEWKHPTTGTATQQEVEEAGQKFDAAHRDRAAKETAMRKAWSDVIDSAGVPENVKTEYGFAVHALYSAKGEVETAKASEQKSPSPETSNALSKAYEQRFQAQQAYDAAEGKVLQSAGPKLSASWREAKAAYEDAVWHEGIAKEVWEEAQKSAGGK